jgi:hypothetical protein
MRPVDRDAAVRWAGLVELVPAGLPGGTNPIGTKTLWEFLSAATKCPVVEVRAEGSTLLVVASMAWSDLARHQVGASPEEVVHGPRIILDLVRAADRNGGDDSAIEGQIGAGNVDDDGLGHLDQRWIRGVVCGGNAAPQPSSAWWRGRSARPLGPQFFTRKVPVTVFVADQ